MYLNGYEIAAMVCMLLVVIILLIGWATDYFEIKLLVCLICMFFAVILLIVGDMQTKNETHSIIEENYENCVFADDNTFFWNDKVYEYKLSEDRSKVNVIYQEGGAKKVVTYELRK